jgi:hypothetical protein
MIIVKFLNMIIFQIKTESYYNESMVMLLLDKLLMMPTLDYLPKSREVLYYCNRINSTKKEYEDSMKRAMIGDKVLPY